MLLLNYIIWDGSLEVFRIGIFSIRWYNLLFALGFLLAYPGAKHIFKAEGKPIQVLLLMTFS